MGFKHKVEVLILYRQSKWVAERLVSMAADRGLPVIIFRPGTISSHTMTGACNSADYYVRLISTFVQLESYPKTNSTISLIPIDYVSKAILHICLAHQLEPKR